MNLIQPFLLRVFGLTIIYYLILLRRKIYHICIVHLGLFDSAMVFFFTRECKYIATCLYLGNRGNLLALWCIYSLYLSPLSIRDTIYVLTISLPIWDTIDVLQNAVFPYHCRTHFVSLQHKQNVQFFKYTTVERMNIYQANEYSIIFIHFCHANLRVWGENTYKEW